MIIRAGYKQITHCRTILRRIRRCKHSGEADMCNLWERREKTHHVSERDEDEYETECHAHDTTHKHNNVVNNLATRLTKKTMRGIMVNFAMNWRRCLIYVKSLYTLLPRFVRRQPICSAVRAICCELRQECILSWAGQVKERSPFYLSNVGIRILLAQAFLATSAR